MSSMMETAAADTHGPSTGPLPFESAAMSYRIKRVGARPLVFSGSELGMAMNYAPHLPSWYEINVYRTTGQSFVLTIRKFFVSADETDYVRAWQLGSIGDVIDVLEAYDAAEDVMVSFNKPVSDTSVAELTSHAMELQAQVKSERQNFASLVGEFLYELEQGG